MATKIRAPMSVAHTAGIFSDMTVDGPEIGTLVTIVDRAKNLPNRKTIGKQDPYCAARLGKEAKKTTTDIRGGQTPKWDQELRFTVHDSPDYYQLKVSVFNDDKKTDLIGETWIDLRDIVVSGGGQSDLWHTLTCKGRYAGDIRMEITYYDTRPKPEKPAAKSKPVAADAQDGQRASRTPVKRRPLPSDPVTGEAPAPPPISAPVSAPVSAPEHAVTPPRVLPKQPVAFIPNQSPLQAVEYNTPSPSRRHQQSTSYSQASGAPPPLAYATPPRLDTTNPHTPRSNDRYGSSFGNEYDERDYSPRHQPYDRRESRGQYSHPPDPYGASSPVDHYRQELPGDDDKPPPPPVHRSRHNSSVNSQDVVVRPSFETPPKNTSPMRHDILKQEAHRRAPSYPGRPAYRPYESAPVVPHPGEEPYHTQSPPRHHSYDNGYDPSRSMQPTVEDVPESPSPLGMSLQTRSRAQSQQQQQQQQQYADAGYDSGRYEPAGYDNVPSPAPLNLSGRRSGQFDRYTPSPQPSYQAEEDYERQPNVSPLSFGDYRNSPGERDLSLPSYSSHHAPPVGELQGNELQVYGMPPVPPSLVPGVDPVLAQEVADRIHEERRQQQLQQEREQLLREQQEQQHQLQLQQQLQQQQQRQYAPQNMGHSTRGRQHNDSSYGYSGSPHPPAPHSYDRAMVTYSSAPSQDRQLVKARSVSPIPPPNPNHTIKRKSVSPAPPPPDSNEGGRRLSGIPFGPDSYDMLNPSLATEKDTKPDPDAKIITHDGREIDPSDHLPMDTWAPEPEPKGPKGATPDNGRQRPGGAQPMPPSGRRPLRVAGRPHSQSAAPAPPPSYTMPADLPVIPSSGGRNRLQKKSNRASASHAQAPPPSTSPLAPTTSYNYQDNGNNFTPSRLPRASTWDYPNENHAPQYSTSPGAPRGMAPPVPAKVPLPIMSGGLGGDPSGQEWALVQEMSRIDIGAGRSRRHGGY